MFSPKRRSSIRIICRKNYYSECNGPVYVTGKQCPGTGALALETRVGRKPKLQINILHIEHTNNRMGSCQTVATQLPKPN